MGEGRPIGFLLAWLIFAPPTLTRWSHVHAYEPAIGEREYARAMFMAVSHLVPDLLGKEAPDEFHIGD